jgi:uncharacterized membrane protein YfcA
VDLELLTGDIWIQVSGIIFAATFIQALTGFGFGLLAVPLLLFVLPSNEAVMAGMILSTLSSLIHGIKMRKLARWDLILRLLFLSIPGLILGVGSSRYMNSTYIKGIVGVVLIVYVAWQWLQFLSNKNRKKGVEGPLQQGDFKENGIQTKSIGFAAAGFFSGILNGLAAIPGPPIVALLVKHLDKDTFHATTVNFFILQYTITLMTKLVLQKGEGVWNVSFAVMILSMLLPISMGLMVGQPIRKRINEEYFKKLVYALLALIGITSVWEPLKLFLS